MHLPFLVLALTLASVTAALAAEPSSVGELIDRAKALASEDLPAALELFDQALRAATTAEQRNQVLVDRCWALAMADPEAAIVLVTKALSDPGTDEPILQGSLRLCRGYAEEQAGRAGDALASYEQVVHLGEALMDPKLEAKALVLRGEQRAAVGQYGDAITDLKRAYDLETQLGQAERQHYALNAMANLYADPRVGQFDLALECYRQLLAFHEASKNLRESATAHFNIASTLESKGAHEAALASYHRALELDQQRGDDDEVAVNQRAIAIVLGKLGRHEEALKLLDQTLAHARESEDEELAAMSRLTRSVALNSLNRHDDALIDLDAALTYFAAAGNQRYLARIHEERAQALAARGSWVEAFNALQSQLECEQALADQLVDERTSRLRVQFATERKEQENRTLARENELKGIAIAEAEKVRRLQLAVLLLSLVVIATLGVLFARQMAHARRMRNLALTDELTQLPNRRHMVTLAEAALQRSLTSGAPCSLIALDIDHFKRINDVHGHAVGDAVLQQVAGTACKALRSGDHLGRTGGEEFLAVLTETTLTQATLAAEHLRTAVEALDLTSLVPDLRVTVSAGVAELGRHERTVSAIWKRADDALYHAKRNGRNQVATG